MVDNRWCSGIFFAVLDLKSRQCEIDEYKSHRISVKLLGVLSALGHMTGSFIYFF